MSIQDDEIVNDPREVAYRRRLAAIRTALGHDHDDATGPQTLDDAIAALCLRHAAALGALAVAESTIQEAQSWIALQNLDPDHYYYDPRAVGFNDRCTSALTAIRKVTP